MNIPLYPLEFGGAGQALSPAQLDRLIAASKLAGVTDLIFLAHGFRCDADAATALFTALLKTLDPNLSRAEFSGNRTFAAAGVYWPSQEFRESFGTSGTAESAQNNLAALRTYCPTPNHAAALDHAGSLLGSLATSRRSQDQFVASLLLAFEDGRGDSSEGLPLLHEYRGSGLLDAARQAIPPGAPAQSFVANQGGIESIPVVDNILGGVDTFLNFMTFQAMKNLAGEVGANGLASSVVAVQRTLDNVRIHLVGHSLGGRLVTACCKALGQQRAAPIQSLSLLEAAFSHFGFTPDAGSGQAGFFREVIVSRIVRGAMISTFSKQDAVVGAAYALASRLAHDQLQAIGDASDPYGGIGHNGAQRTAESTATALHQAGQPYLFRAGLVTCLDGSAGALETQLPAAVIPQRANAPDSHMSGEVQAGLITGHDDVTNQHVTYAVASAICAVD